METDAGRPAEPRAHPAAFPVAMHLRQRREFTHVYDHGTRVRTGNMIFFALPNNAAASRAGIVASRHVGNAVHRNRAKRVLREAWRLNRDRLAVSCDVVLIASPQWKELKLAVIQPEFIRLIEKVNGILRR